MEHSMTNNMLAQFEHELNLYEKGPADKLQDLHDRILAHCSANEFVAYSIGEQDRLQELISETRDRLQPFSGNSPKTTPINLGDHDGSAEKLVNEAEGFFYSGRYAEAIPLYEKALLIEPKWERAKNHLYESESHLRKGSIPTEALPQEVGILYGKAQSAARFGDYGRAKEMLNAAKQILAEYKINRWEEGANLEIQLDNNIAAIDSAKEAEKLFRHGKVDEAVEKLETVASVTGNPRYKEKAREYKEFKQKIDDISTSLNGLVDINYVIETIQEIELLTDEYGQSPMFENVIEKINGVIKDKVQSSVMLLEVSMQDPKGYDLQKNPEYTALLKFLNERNVLVKDETTFIYQKILQANNELAFQGYESYAKVLEALALQYPFNNDVLLRYDWISTKIRINKIRDQRKRDGSARIAFFRIQALVWFWVSVCSAIILLGMSIYVIMTAMSQDNLWITLTSFLSILPVFAARLFYDQSLEANRRVELMQENMNSQEKDDIEDDRRVEQQIFNKIHPKKLSNRKPHQPSIESK